jgi:hypothetical protein
MKSSNHSLDRLFRAAARAPKETPASPPFALEAAVFAQWRAGETGDELAFLVNLFRRAALCASLVMVLALGWSWLERINDSPSKTALPKCAVTVQLRP